MSTPDSQGDDPRPGDSASERILRAYSPDLLKVAGHKLIDELSRHFTAVTNRQTPVLNWNPPRDNIRQAHAMLDDSVPDVADDPQTVARFTDVIRSMLDRGQNLHSPRYIGHQVPAPVPIAGLFDALGSMTNQVMAIYEMGPWALSVEQAMIERIGEQVGFTRGAFSGLITHGGSLANLTALLTARNVTLGDVWEQGMAPSGADTATAARPVLVAHAEAHYGISRAAGIIGLGTQQVVRAALDDRRRIDVERLDRQLAELKGEGHRILAVAANACATPTGAFDRINAIADVCERHGVWLHVDAAHGGAACFSRRYRHLVDGLHRADSVVLDAHKMMFVPALCAFVFYRNPAHQFETFRQDAPYLFDPSAPGMAEFDSGMRNLECTKRAAAFGVWGTWCLFGPRLFEDLVDLTFDLGRTFHALLTAAPDFEPLHEPECNIVAFRYVPAAIAGADNATIDRFQHELRRNLIESGDFYIVQTRLDGRTALRVTIMNPLTTENDLLELLDAVRSTGQRKTHSP